MLLFLSPSVFCGPLLILCIAAIPKKNMRTMAKSREAPVAILREPLEHLTQISQFACKPFLLVAGLSTCIRSLHPQSKSTHLSSLNATLHFIDTKEIPTRRYRAKHVQHLRGPCLPSSSFRVMYRACMGTLISQLAVVSLPHHHRHRHLLWQLSKAEVLRLYCLFHPCPYWA